MPSIDMKKEDSFGNHFFHVFSPHSVNGCAITQVTHANSGEADPSPHLHKRTIP